MGMALSKTLDSGIAVNYFRVSIVKINKRLNTSIVIDVEVYVSKDGRSAGFTPVTYMSYEVDAAHVASFASVDAVSAAYSYLKTLSDFAGEVDC